MSVNVFMGWPDILGKYNHVPRPGHKPNLRVSAIPKNMLMNCVSCWARVVNFVYKVSMMVWLDQKLDQADKWYSNRCCLDCSQVSRTFAFSIQEFL